jgi:protoheme ferro-lyase
MISLVIVFSLLACSIAFQPVPPATATPPPSSSSPSLLKSTLSNETLNIIDNYSKKVSGGSSVTSEQPSERKLAVLFLNLGGPETLKVSVYSFVVHLILFASSFFTFLVDFKDVRGFLYNLFKDPDIIRLPSFLSIFQKPIAYYIAKTRFFLLSFTFSFLILIVISLLVYLPLFCCLGFRCYPRAPKSSEGYRMIGGGSPINRYTSQQCQLVKQFLKMKLLSSASSPSSSSSKSTSTSTLPRFSDVKCYFAMRYWKPYTKDVLPLLLTDGITDLVILPLYPQYSISTSGSSLKQLKRYFLRQPGLWKVRNSKNIVLFPFYPCSFFP